MRTRIVECVAALLSAEDHGTEGVRSWIQEGRVEYAKVVLKWAS